MKKIIEKVLQSLELRLPNIVARLLMLSLAFNFNQKPLLQHGWDYLHSYAAKEKISNLPSDTSTSQLIFLDHSKTQMVFSSTNSPTPKSALIHYYTTTAGVDVGVDYRVCLIGVFILLISLLNEEFTSLRKFPKENEKSIPQKRCPLLPDESTVKDEKDEKSD